MNLSVKNTPLYEYEGEESADESEKYLIGGRRLTDALFSKNDKACLVLIENASELARRAIFDNNLLPVWGKQIATHFGKNWVGILDNNMRSNKQLKKKKTLKDSDFGLIHNHAGDSHFGCFIVSGSDIYIYDSMSNVSNFKTFETGLVRYYDISKFQLLFVIREFPYQETGGFYGYLSQYDQILLEEMDDEAAREYEIRRINESIESQNHFCYMWSLYNLIAHFKGIDPDIPNKDPLGTIKRFMYGVLKNKKIQYRPLFDAWFLKCWDTKGIPHNGVEYYVRNIQEPPATNNIVESFSKA